MDTMNYLIRKPSDETVIHLTSDSAKRLRIFKPKGCYFKDYSMLDLLKDFVQMYDWIVPRFSAVSIVDFINKLKEKDYKAEVYGDDLISLLVE